jgi:hypothetical protein
MNFLIKITGLLLFALGLHAPLMAQKKLALANECFKAEAYYLANRYYQQAFDNLDQCHPDQIKFAQSLTVTQQLSEAEHVYTNYLNCQKNDPEANIAYGKFLINIHAYEKAISYFQRSLEAKPEQANRYIIACQNALSNSNSNEMITPFFVNQEPEINVPGLELPKVEEVVENTPSAELVQLEETSISKEEKDHHYSISSAPITQTIQKTSANNLDSLKKIRKPDIQNNKIPFKTTAIKVSSESEKEEIKILNKIKVEKKNSPYGVRLGAYQPSKVPNLSSVENYGTIEEKIWNGKIIYYLVGFSNRDEAEEALKLVRNENFRSSILVKKQAGGRMKSIQ